MPASSQPFLLVILNPVKELNSLKCPLGVAQNDSSHYPFRYEITVEIN
jgi:hypothetical protein